MLARRHELRQIKLRAPAVQLHFMSLFLAALSLSVSPPPPPPFFGCSTQGSCLRVLIEADESTEGSQECAQALEAVSEYATDYEAAGADADSGVSFFRARHNQHDTQSFSTSRSRHQNIRHHYSQRGCSRNSTRRTW